MAASNPQTAHLSPSLADAIPAGAVECVLRAVRHQRVAPSRGPHFSHWWIYDSNGLGIPTDFVNVWSAGRLALDGHPALAWDWDIQQVRARGAGSGFAGNFAWHYPPPSVRRRRCWRISFTAAFIGWVATSLVPYLA